MSVEEGGSQGGAQRRSGGAGDIGLQQPSYNERSGNSFETSPPRDPLSKATRSAASPSNRASSRHRAASGSRPGSGNYPMQASRSQASERSDAGELSRGVSPTSFATAEDDDDEDDRTANPIRPITAGIVSPSPLREVNAVAEDAPTPAALPDSSQGPFLSTQAPPYPGATVLAPSSKMVDKVQSSQGSTISVASSGTLEGRAAHGATTPAPALTPSASAQRAPDQARSQLGVGPAAAADNLDGEYEMIEQADVADHDGSEMSRGYSEASERSKRSKGRRRSRGTVAQRAATAAANTSSGKQIDVPGRTASLSSSHAGTRNGSVGSDVTSQDDSFQSAEQQLSAGLSSAGTRASMPSTSTSERAEAAASNHLRLSSTERRLLQRWILSIGCVTFDLELGPDLEFLYPPLGISKEEKDNIAFSSFPDTSIFDDGFTTFSWRVREVPLHSSESVAPVIGGVTSTPASVSVSAPASTSGTAAGTPSGSVSRASNSPNGGTDNKLLPAFLNEPPVGSSSGPASPVIGAKSGGSLVRKKSSIFERAKALHHRDSSTASTDGGDIGAALANSDPSGHGVAEVDIRSSMIMRELELRSAGAIVVEGGRKGDASAGSEGPAHAAVAAAAPNARRGGGSTSSSYIYGVCFFRQKRDASIRRGYFQKSVVILSHLPYVSLLSELVSRLGPAYFEHGHSILETFAKDVMRWPAPEPGATLSLPVLGSVLTVALPIGAQFQGDAASNAFIPSATNPSLAVSLLSKKKISQPGKMLEPEPILASIPSTYLIDAFRECLPDLWLLWESMLLADPILVIGPDPKACSEAVWHLLDLIRPIPFAGDFRPYFHIHDYDCRALVTKNKPQAGTVLGVTNPFFLMSCGHWPNILRVGKPPAKSTRSGPLGIKKNAAPTQPGIAGGMGAGGGGPEHQPGLKSARKRRASKDRQLLKAVIDAVEKQESVEAANGMLRRYFSDLTERFLQPLNRYVASLVPSPSDMPTSPGEPLRIRPFNTNDFLAMLKANGTPLLLKNRSLPTGSALRQSLYIDFLKCPNFSLWLQAKVSAAEDDNWGRRIKALETGDVTSFAARNTELDTIDLFSRLKEEIRHVDARLAADQSSVGPGSRWRSDGIRGSSSDLSLDAGGIGSRADAGAASAKLQSITHSACSASATSRTLTAKRSRLINQLERLADALPADLRGSVNLADVEQH